MKTWIYLCIALIAPVAILAAEPSVPADGDYDDDVYRRLDAIEAQLSGLRRLPEHEFLPAAHAYEFPCPNCGHDPEYCDCNGAGDGKYPTAKITGFFQLDAGFYDQDAVNRLTLGDIEDGVGFRRARLAGKGEVAEDVSYILEVDFAQAQARFVDVWMQFAETPFGNVRIGRYRQPFGMSELTSVRELPFVERPLTFALAPFRQTGIILFDSSADERMTWAMSGYRYLSDNFGNVYADTGGYGMATRLTYVPIDCGDERLVHLGVDYSFNDPGRGLVQYASTNEFFVGQNPTLGPGGLSVLPIVAVPPFVNTGAMPTERTNLLDVEGAVSFGRLILQSEARWAMLGQTSGGSNTFPGAYAHVRYVLTGETIPYNRQNGVFGRIRPLAPVDLWCGQWGAWEIAARWSCIDLNGTALPGPGRRLNDTTAGFNWYVNDHTKFQFNWIHAELSDATEGDSTADTLAMRGQINF